MDPDIINKAFVVVFAITGLLTLFMYAISEKTSTKLKWLMWFLLDLAGVIYFW